MQQRHRDVAEDRVKASSSVWQWTLQVRGRLGILSQSVGKRRLIPFGSGR